MSKSALQLKALAAGILLALAGNASAAIYTNVPGGATNGLPFASFGNGANPSGDSPKVGEVFSLSSASTLSAFSFYALGDTTPSGTFQLNIAQWNPGNSVGTPLLTTLSSAIETFNAAAGITTISFSNLGLNLAAGTKYIAYLSSTDPVTGIQLSRTQTAQDASGFGLGTGYLSNIPGQGWQFPFNGFLSLQYTAVTADVPEPGTVALMMAGLALAGVARRRKDGKK